MVRGLICKMSRFPGFVWVAAGLFDPALIGFPDQVFYTRSKAGWEGKEIHFEDCVAYEGGTDAEKLVADKTAKGLM